jgi:hypothetical protein
MKQDKIVNAGGINGLGASLVNTNSKDFKILKDLIKQNQETQAEAARMENGLLSVRFQMESYLNASLELEDISPAGSFIEKLLKVIKVSKKQFAD